MAAGSGLHGNASVLRPGAPFADMLTSQHSRNKLNPAWDGAIMSPAAIAICCGWLFAWAGWCFASEPGLGVCPLWILRLRQPIQRRNWRERRSDEALPRGVDAQGGDCATA